MKVNREQKMKQLFTLLLLSQVIALSFLGHARRSFAAAVTPTSTPTVVSAYLAGLGNAKTIVVGHTLQFTAHVTYSDDSVGELPDAQGNTVTWWGTSNPSVATISGGGNVTAVSAGTVNIEAKIGALKVHPRGVTVIEAVVPAVVQQPTVSCSANPSIINQGGTTTITATGWSAQNLPLTYSYSPSTGSISGTGSTATLQTPGTSAGILTVMCTVEQQGGGTASATTNVLLQSVTGAQALTNFRFTDSVGVNLHLAFAGTIYQTQFPQIMQSMLALGITHYRDGLNQYAQPFQYQNAEALGKVGMKADWLMDIHSSASIINSAYANAPDTTAGFEGPNEDDADAGSNLSAFMQLLHQTVQGNPATAAMPVIGPSFVQVSSFATQGNLSSLVNSGNMHDYFGTFNPETGPYGGAFYNCGGYGSIQFNICLARMVGVGEPVTSTETGYQSGTGLSDAIIGRYELRTLFEGLSLGVPRTYIYELIDDASGNWGLLTASFSPRPAYTAIQNVLALLKDVSFPQPGKLDYSLAGETQNVNQVLLQKSNGSFYLAIWLAVPSADPSDPSTVYNVSPQSVTLTANTPVAATTTYVLDDSGNMTSTTGELTNGSMPILVTDRITLVSLSPGQSQ
jgi:Bacterial Ig-like domain (group 2)